VTGQSWDPPETPAPLTRAMTWLQTRHGVVGQKILERQGLLGVDAYTTHILFTKRDG
jgi:hypothetical protein